MTRFDLANRRLFAKAVDIECPNEANENSPMWDALMLLFKGAPMLDVTCERDTLTLSFDGVELSISDAGQSCCEHRHMTCDDDLNHYKGAAFLNARTEEMQDNGDDEYGVHNQHALIVETSLGSFTIVNHNEHNGYYGGFMLKADVKDLIMGSK